jgi:hemerythrin-like metal-binding protein
MEAFMALVEWQGCYSVGNERIDQQHQRLVGLINQLGEAMDTGAERPTLMKILNSLAGYTKTHFSEEERLMEERGYPELASHKEEHVVLNRRLADFYREFYTTSRPQSAEVMVFLQGWLYNHILEKDKLYQPFLGE